MGATSGLSGGVRPFGRVEADQRLNGRAHSISVSLYLLREKDLAVHSEATKICDDSMKDSGGCELVTWVSCGLFLRGMVF